MYEKFTDRARQVMQLANQEAQRFNHEYIGTEHILLGLIKEGNGVAANVLKNLDVDLRKIRLEVERLVQSGPDKVSMGRLPLTPRANRVIEYSMEEISHLNHNYVGTEHLLLGLAREQEGVSAKVLLNLGLKLEHIREEVLNLLGHGLEVDEPTRSDRGGDDGKEREHKELVDRVLALDRNVDRILDAAANRGLEGLRVVEDFARLALDDAHLTRLAKELRHELASAYTALPWDQGLAARDTRHDVGTNINTPTEAARADAWDVCTANLERSKQSLRSLEEFSKLLSPDISSQFERLRYRLYTLEKSLGLTHDSLQRLAAVRLCVLIDGRDTADEFQRLVEALISAEVGMIQMRDKRPTDADLVDRARLLRQATRDSEVLFIVNDRPDIAAAVDADGVHLGQDDMDVKDARAILGPRKLIGVSTHNLEQAQAAVLDGANYLGAGPTFPSSTKAFEDFPGLELLRQVAAEIRLPTFAIGGIGPDNLPQVLETGTVRVAVGGAAIDASDPGKAVTALNDMLTSRPPAPAGG